jgi:hypothetical protein
MKKLLLTASSVFVAGFALYCVQRIERLSARVAVLESSLLKTESLPTEQHQRHELRIVQLETRVTSVERLLDEEIVRRKVDLDVRSIRDLPFAAPGKF